MYSDYIGCITSKTYVVGTPPSISETVLLFKRMDKIYSQHIMPNFNSFVYMYRPPDKSVYWKIIFFISYQKHMLWVLKRNVSMRWFFRAPKTHV